VAAVTAMIEPRNVASARVAERLGFTVRNREDRNGYDYFICHLLRPTAQES
jgi:RimJ/RimL family protein N-acetyltransferase